MSYDLLKTIHMLAAYVWLGSLFGSLVFATVQTRRRANGVLVGALAIFRFSTRVGLPAAIILMIAGIWMMVGYGVANGAWISAGFVLWLLAALGGSGLMHPAARRLRNAATDAEAVEAARRIVLIGGGEIILVAIAIWVMGAKPGG